MQARLAAAIFFAAMALPACVQADTASAVTLDTGSGILAGTLLMPAHTERRIPVVLLISGSGPTDRDGNAGMMAGRNDSLKMLAEAMADAGIASLRYDKRGVAASAMAMKGESDLRFEDYVNDAVAWGRTLKADRRFSRIVVAGHSEGSLIGMLATSRITADAMISLSGAGRRAGAILNEQIQARGTPGMVASTAAIVTSLEKGEMVTETPAELAALFRPGVQPYLISWFKYDPAAELARLRVPLLVIQGTTDVQVSEGDAMKLAASNRKAQLVVIGGMNHVLKDVGPDMHEQVSSYGNPALPLDSQLVRKVIEFVKSISKAARP